MYIYVTRGWNNNNKLVFFLKKKIKEREGAVAAMGRHWRHEAGDPASQSLFRVQSWAARTAAWAGSEWTGASSEPCDLAGVSLDRWAKQTSACRRVSNEGRHKCCSRFPLCAPWTCSWGCTSPAIGDRRTHTHKWVSMKLAGRFAWFACHSFITAGVWV